MLPSVSLSRGLAVSLSEHFSGSERGRSQLLSSALPFASHHQTPSCDQEMAIGKTRATNMPRGTSRFDHGGAGNNQGGGGLSPSRWSMTTSMSSSLLCKAPPRRVAPKGQSSSLAQHRIEDRLHHQLLSPFVAHLTGVWRELALAEPPQAPDLRELSVGQGFCGQMWGRNNPPSVTYSAVRCRYVREADGQTPWRNRVRVRPLDIGAYATAWDWCTPTRCRGRRTRYLTDMSVPG